MTDLKGLAADLEGRDRVPGSLESGERLPGSSPVRSFPAAGWPRAIAAILAVALGLTLVPPSHATRMAPLTIERLATLSSVVVHGRVESIEAAKDGAGRIHTRIGLRVMEVWKGEVPGGLCEIVAGGGVLGDRAVSVAGQATYAVAEEVVAFLARNPEGVLVTVGLAQGHFGVRVDASSGRRWVSNLFWGELEEAAGRGVVRMPSRRPLAIEELRRRAKEARP